MIAIAISAMGHTWAVWYSDDPLGVVQWGVPGAAWTSRAPTEYYPGVLSQLADGIVGPGPDANRLGALARPRHARSEKMGLQAATAREVPTTELHSPQHRGVLPRHSQLRLKYQAWSWGVGWEGVRMSDC